MTTIKYALQYTRKGYTQQEPDSEVTIPSLHSFQRTFALNLLRAGVDIISLEKLMGHDDLQVLCRYLAQTTDDIAKAHWIGSPVDRGKLWIIMSDEIQSMPPWNPLADWIIKYRRLLTFYEYIHPWVWDTI